MKVIRTLDTGTQDYTRVNVLDKPGAGGACHEYEVQGLNRGNEDIEQFASISFQNGPIKENGVNGCHQEDLLVIVIDRLRSFQAGAYKCLPNAIALTKIEEALHWLRSRTEDRLKRGVEGTSKE